MQRSRFITFDFTRDFEPTRIDLVKLDVLSQFFQTELKEKKRTYWERGVEYPFLLSAGNGEEEVHIQLSHSVRSRKVKRKDPEHPQASIKERYFDVINHKDLCGEGGQAHLYGLMGFFYLNPFGQLSFIRHHSLVIKLFDVSVQHFNKKFIKREAKFLQDLPYIRGKPAQFTHKKENISPFASITMRRVPGVSLRTLLNDPKSLRTDQRILLGWRAARGLAYLHAKNIIHRDIKLENILVDEFTWPYVVDMGLAIHAKKVKAEYLGSFAHLPPEAVTSNYQINALSDVYSYATVLACLFGSKGRPLNRRLILAELLCGREPDTMENLFEVCSDLSGTHQYQLRRLIERLERVEQPKRATLAECELTLQKIYYERILWSHDNALRPHLMDVMNQARELRVSLAQLSSMPFSSRWQKVPILFGRAVCGIDSKNPLFFGVFLQTIDIIFLNKSLTATDVLDLTQDISRRFLEFENKISLYLERLRYNSRVLYGCTGITQYELLKRRLSLLLCKGDRLAKRIKEVNILMDDLFLLCRKFATKLEQFYVTMQALITELHRHKDLSLVKEVNGILDQVANQGGNTDSYGNRLRAVMRQYIANELTEGAVQNRSSVASRHRLNEMKRILSLIGSSSDNEKIQNEISGMRNQLFGTLPSRLAAVKPSGPSL